EVHEERRAFRDEGKLRTAYGVRRRGPRESYVIVEERPGARPPRTRGARTEMLPRAGGGHPSTRRATDHADAHQEGFDDRLDRLGLFAHRYGERRESHRAAVEAREERLAHGAIEPVQPERVDVVQLEGLVHGGVVGGPAVHERVVAH